MLPGVLLGPRVEDYWIELLNGDDGPLGTLDGLQPGARVSQNYDTPIRGGLTLEVRRTTLNADTNWMTTRLRPWASANGLAWPLGVYVPASPKDMHDAAGMTWRLSCLDKTAVLDNDKVTTTYQVPAGAIVTAHVRSLITGAGEERVALTDSPLFARELTVWPAGTSRLRIINDLLESINYTALWCDGEGQFRAEPYIPPAQRPLAAQMHAGPDCVVSPAFDRTVDVASVPNRVILTAQGGGDTPPLVGIAENVDPASRYSFPARGYWVARTYSVEAADQSTIDALARRYLATASTPPAYLEVEHAALPLRVDDVVSVQLADVTTLAVVNEYDMTLTVGALTSAKWLEVA